MTAIELGKVGLLALALPVIMAAAPTSPPSWSQAATADLVGMHDLIRDNHPGPVDPENPGFRGWLDGGEAELLPKARIASSLHDYQLVLRDYANGFADGHLGVVMNDPEDHLWPGFLVRADAPNAPLRVAVTAFGPDAPSDVKLGVTIVSCGGISARQLIEDRVLRPALNPHVPQRLRLASASLMVADADDPAGQWSSCLVSSDNHVRTLPLRWRPISPTALAQAKMRSSGIDVPATGLRRIGDIWLVSMPSFYPQSASDTKQLQDLVAQVKAQAGALHAARHVVLDLRGNDGGDDAWGFEVAEALWGKTAVQAVSATMPQKIEWRVSVRNAAAIHEDATRMGQQGQPENASYFGGLADQMDHALKRHDPFMQELGDPVRPRPQLVSPFANPVYLLTTPHCASACLDFVDLMDGLPGVVRVGLETSSDTDYLELAEAKLPSGHATLHYAMKVYRERKRGANVSYKPELAWPGGEMNDASIAQWITPLK